MRRTRAASACTALGVGALLGACVPSPPVPTMVVEPRPFELRVTAEGVLAAATATRVGVPTDLDEAVRLAWIAPEGATVAAGEVVARFDPSEMERRLVEGRSDLASATAEARKTTLESEVTLAKVDTQLETARLELAHADRYQKTDDVLFSRHDIVESAIDLELAAERRDNATSTLAVQSELGQTRVDLVGIKQRKANLKIDRARTGLEALEVRAPHAGVLTLVRNWLGDPPEVGSEVWPGQEIAEIPDLATLQAEVFVLEADAGGLEAGKPAEVVVEAHPGVSYPARISQVDPVAKPRTRGSPVQYFAVTLALDRTDRELMKPGQRVRATLVLEHLEKALVVPRQALQLLEGGHRVLVVQGGDLVPRPVELGASSAGLVVVSSGLTAGEEIALRPPEGRAPGVSDGDAEGPGGGG